MIGYISYISYFDRCHDRKTSSILMINCIFLLVLCGQHNCGKPGVDLEKMRKTAQGYCPQVGQ